MTHNRHVQKLLVVTGLLVTLSAGGIFSFNAEAQGGVVSLRLPFNGTRRLTSYVDHRFPDPNSHDGKMVVYMGEERLDCPDCGQIWDNQGPYCYDGHTGTDYALYLETVLAAASGRVTLAHDVGGYIGKAIHIDHGNAYQTRYFHLNDIFVSVGDEVVTGQQIGISGNTGTNMPYHLHFGVYHNGYATDPFGWRGSGADPIPGGPAICLWGDGQCSEIVVEDKSTWFHEYGTGWNWDCKGNSWTLRYVTNRNISDSASASWRPDLPRAGPYAVLAFVPKATVTAPRTTNATYIINDKSGSHAVAVNQQNYSDEWVYLGSYDFWATTIGNVELDNVTGEANGSTKVVFDSIKFRQFRIYLPAVLRNYP